MPRREVVPDNDPERRGFKDIAQALGHGGRGGEGVEDILFQRKSVLPHGSGQNRGHGETVFRAAGFQRLVQRGGKVPRVGVEVVARGEAQTIPHGHEPVRVLGTGKVLPAEEKKIVNEKGLAAGHGPHEGGGVFGDGGGREGAREIGGKGVGHGRRSGGEGYTGVRVTSADAHRKTPGFGAQG